MNENIRLIIVSMLLCLYFSLLTYAREGMLMISGGKTEACYLYRNEDDSYVKNEWKQVWDNWYYFGDDGCTKQNTWAEIDGKWYYFNEWGIMLADTTTPDGNYVGADGA